MGSRMRAGLSYSNVIATLALMIALGRHVVCCGRAGEEQRQVEEHCEWRRYVVED